MYIEYGFNQKARIFVEDNDIIRVIIKIDMDWIPGQHCFLRFRKFGWHGLTSHPFTICSLPSKDGRASEAVFHIRVQGGFTSRLFKEALKEPGCTVPVFVDGPYGGVNCRRLIESDRLLLIAGGSGAGWILPFMEMFAREANFTSDLKQAKGDKKHATTEEVAVPLQARRSLGHASMRVILATRDSSTQSWFQQTAKQLLGETYARNGSGPVSVETFLTRETQRAAPTSADNSSQSGADSITEKPDVERTARSEDLSHQSQGRPALPDIIHEEAANLKAGQMLGIFVCGPESMQADALNAAALENLSLLKRPGDSGGVYLHLEHFNWA
jgi:ferredoxin-NADP reductase